MIDAIPDVTFVVALLSLGVSLVYGIGRRLLTNVEEIKRMTTELGVYNKELRQAIKSGDKDKVAKLKKKETQMKMNQSKVAMQNMKPTLAFMLPFLLLWSVGIPAIIGPNSATIHVAISPISLNFIPIYPLTCVICPDNPIIGFGVSGLNKVGVFAWYLITSFSFQGMVSKLLRIT